MSLLPGVWIERLQRSVLLVSLLAVFVTFLIGASAVYAADSVTTDRKLRQEIVKVLDHEGYLGQYPNGQDVARGISAYLWDNRQRLITVEFHNARKIDVLVCLMVQKGYPEFIAYANNPGFMSWCNRMLK